MPIMYKYSFLFMCTVQKAHLLKTDSGGAVGIADSKFGIKKNNYSLAKIV